MMKNMRGDKDFNNKNKLAGNEGTSAVNRMSGSGFERTPNKLFENRIEREWLSTKDAAHFLRVSENALRIMVHRDQIKVYKFGARLRFTLNDCLALFTRKGV